MDPKLQRRVQRYGWDKAVGDYEAGWRAQLEPAQTRMLELAEIEDCDRVLDVACGTGLVTFQIAKLAGPGGAVVGTDISEGMIMAARRQAALAHFDNTRFERADAEQLALGDELFDAVVCALGLMYVPRPVVALREMRRHLKPGGRAAVAVWGARAKCGWADVFPITDARVASEVCPMFFQLGTGDLLAWSMQEAGFADLRCERLSVTLEYPSGDAALAAAFRGGPVALAYKRFDAQTRADVHREYLESIDAYRDGDGYAIPGEFVIGAGRNPGT